MQVNFYIEGGVVPAYYDYAMDADGVLWPSKRQIPGIPDRMYIVLEQYGNGPTKGQRMTINTVRTINPDWTLKFFFPMPDTKAP
jgi:hypothetical protein